MTWFTHMIIHDMVRDKNGPEMQLSSGDLFSGFNNVGPLLWQKSDSSSSIRSRMSEVYGKEKLDVQVGALSPEMQLSSGDLFSGFNNFGPLLRQKSDSSSSIRSRMSEVGDTWRKHPGQLMVITVDGENSSGISASPASQIYPAISTPLTSQQLKRIENATNRIVNNARTLDAEIETQWAKHKRPRRWALMEKAFEHFQIKGEESSHAAYALKKYLEACTDQDFEEMGKTRQEAEQAFQLLETLTPLATPLVQGEENGRWRRT
ncbi:hypothetical protein EV426DRAFT_682337 [Tirmania nivea]|nr:hypothetical protein EV426DRAFT_682337 [Tirmania nivea]